MNRGRTVFKLTKQQKDAMMNGYINKVNKQIKE